MGTVVVLMGVSGAGKSTWIKENFEPPDRVEYSTDHWFIEVDKKTGEIGYKMVPSELGQAHGHCLKLYAEALHHYEERHCGRTIIVDNTNTSLVEMAPYCALALAYGFELRIVVLVCPPVVAFERNVHDVPKEAIFRQHARLEGTLKNLPPWWKAEEVVTG